MVLTDKKNHISFRAVLLYGCYRFLLGTLNAYFLMLCVITGNRSFVSVLTVQRSDENRNMIGTCRKTSAGRERVKQFCFAYFPLNAFPKGITWYPFIKLSAKCIQPRMPNRFFRPIDFSTFNSNSRSRRNALKLCNNLSLYFT